MDKKSLLIAGAAAMLILGVIVAVSATEQATTDTKERGPPCGG